MDCSALASEEDNGVVKNGLAGHCFDRGKCGTFERKPEYSVSRIRVRLSRPTRVQTHGTCRLVRARPSMSCAMTLPG